MHPPIPQPQAIPVVAVTEFNVTASVTVGPDGKPGVLLVFLFAGAQVSLFVTQQGLPGVRELLERTFAAAAAGLVLPTNGHVDNPRRGEG